MGVFPAGMSESLTCLVPIEFRRSHQILWN